MSTLQTVKVLLVEDSPSDARLVQSGLAEAGNFEVTWAERLDAALGKLREQSFDVGLIDLGLPDSTGSATFLRVMEAAPMLPLIVLTGVADEALGAEAVRSGVQDYLVKSYVDGRTLARAIRYAVERKQAKDAGERFSKELEHRAEELKTANESLRESRRAALNLMEDADEARRKAEWVSAELARDIAQRKKAEEGLLQSREEWVETFNVIPDLIAILDNNHRILRANKAMAEKLGVTPEEVIGLPCYKCVHDSAEPIAFCPHSLMLKDGVQHVAEIHEERLGGDFLVSVTPMLDESGAIKGCVHVARDITDIKKAQAALREERNFVNAVLQTTGGLIVGLDLEGRIQIFNHACEKITGYAFEEVRGRPFWDFLLVPEEVEQVKAVFKGIVDGSIPPESENETFWVARDGERHFIRWANTALKADDGTLSMILGTGVDISERKTMEELVRLKAVELTAANKELDAFAYSVSHDLRAPLHVIMGFSQLLLENYGEALGVRGKEFIDTLMAEVERMSRLISDMLYLSRVTRQEMQRGDADLSAVAEEVAGSLRKEHPGRRVEVVIRKGLLVKADNRLVEIVLRNLLGNAWKFTKNRENARIEFGETIDRGKRVFFVRDNGAGFDMRNVQRLFNPFQRLHTRGEFEGTGIGLAIVKRVVQRHGGEVWAQAREGEGAEFYFTLE